jgi:signal transduction histidine kinase
VAHTDASVRLEAQHDLGLAYTDRRRLTQSLVNAVLNARTLAGSGKIVVRAARRGEQLHFEVQVLGVVLQPAQLAHALDPLSAVHSPTLRLGSGLALVVTRKLLSLLGGAFEVRNAADGAVFVLTAAAALPDQPATTSAAA